MCAREIKRLQSREGGGRGGKGRGRPGEGERVEGGLQRNEPPFTLRFRESCLPLPHLAATLPGLPRPVPSQKPLAILQFVTLAKDFGNRCSDCRRRLRMHSRDVIIVMAAEWLKWAILNRRRSRRDCKPNTKNSGNEYPTPLALACRRHPEPERRRRQLWRLPIQGLQMMEELFKIRSNCGHRSGVRTRHNSLICCHGRRCAKRSS